ncbi:MAG: NifB/NifX family molybdenum-iron cluster-binding protein [Chloroflexota bacterium]
MKIAVVTDDGTTISKHFGRAAYYQVVTVEDGRIVGRELRDKLGHAHFAHEPHEPGLPGQPHGTGPSAQSRHARMAEAIGDCQAVICGGMGMGAYESFRERGIRPAVTSIELIDDAALAFAEGRLVDQLELLH